LKARDDFNMSKSKSNEFRFRMHDTVAAPAAEDDTQLLYDCFLDSGNLDILRDCDANQRIIVGRTGSGKSALCLMLKQSEERSKFISPESLSLQYLTNISILKQLSELGVKLDLFYKLLWKHILVVEFIKLRYSSNSESELRHAVDALIDRVKPEKNRKKSIGYLEQWGDKFWHETEERVREVTEKLENKITSDLGINSDLLRAGVKSGSKITIESRQEYRSRAQEIVNKIQITELDQVIEILRDFSFNDGQKRFFLIIDRLDENWIEDNLRYQLIKALIETVKDFSKLKNTKIVVVLRRDLLDRVIRATKDSGFQEEKLRPFILQMKWSKSHLFDLLDRRINNLVRRRYTKQKVCWQDLLPEKVDKKDVSEYIIERTMYRPRDMLEFFNCIIEQAIDQPNITAEMLKSAEGQYSKNRLKSLEDEWFADFPMLREMLDILRYKGATFSSRDIDDGELEEICLKVLSKEIYPNDDLYKVASQLSDGKITHAVFKGIILHILYSTGLIGIKVYATEKTSWSFVDGGTIRSAELLNDVTVDVCPMFYRVLGVDYTANNPGKGQKTA